MVRHNHGRSATIIDAQSVKNTSTAKDKGYDGGKKVSGIKQHIAGDVLGLPHALLVTTATVSDKADARQMIGRQQVSLRKTKKVLVDGGYDGQPFADAVAELIQAKVELVKRNELHTFKVLPKRWIVERSFAWLEKCHRLWKNPEYYLNTSLHMMVLAFVALLLGRF